MKCDDVFEILTRGPFPAGSTSDEAVELHLDQCAECARLARALEPALGLIHESLGPDEATDLPEYWGRLSREPQSPRLSWSAERPVADSTSLSGPSSQPRRTLPLIALSVSIVAGLLIAAGLSEMPTPGQQEAEPAPTVGSLGLSLACLQTSGTGGHAEDSIDAQTPLAVRQSSVTSRLCLPDGRQLACCTTCHRSGQTERQAIAPVARLTQTCLLCHAGLN